MTKNNFILYAEDDTDDRTWVNEACKILNCALKISFVENGRQVLDYLKSPFHLLSSLICRFQALYKVCMFRISTENFLHSENYN